MKRTLLMASIAFIPTLALAQSAALPDRPIILAQAAQPNDDAKKPPAKPAPQPQPAKPPAAQPPKPAPQAQPAKPAAPPAAAKPVPAPQQRQAQPPAAQPPKPAPQAQPAKPATPPAAAPKAAQPAQPAPKAAQPPQPAPKAAQPPQPAPKAAQPAPAQQPAAGPKQAPAAAQKPAVAPAQQAQPPATQQQLPSALQQTQDKLNQPVQQRQNVQQERREDRKLDALRAERKETKDGNRTVIQERDRTIIRQGDRTIVRHDDDTRFRRGGAEIRERRRGNQTERVIVRPNGVRIVTVVDDNGRLVRRSRFVNGREYVLFRNRPSSGFNFIVNVPPPVVRIPRDRYIVEYREAPPPVIYETLVAPPVMRLERAYSLDEVRYNYDVRARMPRIDIDSINFETGSWDVSPDQAEKLAPIAEAMKRAIAANPNEVYMVEGHTDAVGSNDDNLLLSDRRAQAVTEILTQDFGVPPENMIPQGYGEQNLKVDTAGPEARNRYVSVRRVTPLLAQQQQR